MSPIALRYQFGPAEFLARERLLNGDPWQQARWSVWKDTLLFAVLCLFGLVAALEAESFLIGLVFGTALLARLTVPWEQRSKFKLGMSAFAEKKIRRRDVSLTFDEQGLAEEVEGVRSVAPWHTVKSFQKFEHVFLLELCGEMWAVIPEVAFLGAGAPSEAEFMSLLQARGVPEKGKREGVVNVLI